MLTLNAAVSMCRDFVQKIYFGLRSLLRIYMQCSAFGLQLVCSHSVYNKSNRRLHITYLSNALTLPSSFLLLRQLIRTCVLFFTDWVRTESGPVLNSSSSRFWSSSGVISDLGLFNKLLTKHYNS